MRLQWLGGCTSGGRCDHARCSCSGSSAAPRADVVTTFDAPVVARRLHLGPEYAAWLEAVGASPGGIAPPTGEAAARLLAKLGLDEADRAAVVGALPSRHAQPELSWLLERAYHAVLADIGHLDSVLRIGERDSGTRSGQPDRTLRIGERDSGARSG